MKFDRQKNIGLFLIACVYCALVSTKDIQEDAYITFRVAFHLVDHHIFSFNLDEQYSSVTSFLYPLGIALLRCLFGSFALFVVQFVNASAVLLACWIFAKVVSDFFQADRVYRNQLFFLLALMPHTLVLAVRSMEIPYVILLFVAGLRGLQTYLVHNANASRSEQKKEGIGLMLFAVGCLPFIRPDAVAFSLIIVVVAGLIKRTLAIWCSLSVLISVIVYVVLNEVIFGSLLPHTIAAKAISYHAISFAGLFKNWIAVMNEVAFPVDVKYLYGIKPLCGFVMAIAFWFLLQKIKGKNHHQFLIFLGMLFAIVAIPSAYVLGGVIFPWYLWPSQFLGAGLVLAGTIYGVQKFSHHGMQKIGWVMTVGCVFLMMTFQLMRSYNWGVMEGEYRASIGQYLSRVAQKQDTLFLEPAGYIPFYAGLKTIDEIGLASPIVLKYKKENHSNWWFRCLQKENPTFLVQREHILAYRTHDGYQLTPEEIAWFQRHYALLVRAVYKPEDYTHNPFLLRLLKFSKTHDYYVFQRRAEPCSPSTEKM